MSVGIDSAAGFHRNSHPELAVGIRIGTDCSAEADMNYFTGKKVTVVSMNSIVGVAFTEVLLVASIVKVLHSHHQCSMNFHLLNTKLTVNQMQTTKCY